MIDTDKLLASGAKPGKEGVALNWAVEHHQHDVVSALLEVLEEGRHSTLNGALHVAAEFGNENAVEMLLAAGADVHHELGPRRSTAIHVAAQYGNCKIIQMLIDVGANILTCTADWKTAAHIAQEYSKFPALKHLLAFLQPHETNELGETALHLASEFGDTETTKRLLENHAELNAVDCEQATPLRYAVEFGSSEVVELLLRAGAKLLADGRGCTPLHVAASLRSRRKVKALLDTGACLANLPNLVGDTPLHEAVKG